MGVIYFGDLLEDTVTNGMKRYRFSKLMLDRAGYRYREELGTLPSVYYLPPMQRMFPVESGLEDTDESIKGRYKECRSTVIIIKKLRRMQADKKLLKDLTPEIEKNKYKMVYHLFYISCYFLCRNLCPDSADR